MIITWYSFFNIYVKWWFKMPIKHMLLSPTEYAIHIRDNICVYFRLIITIPFHIQRRTLCHIFVLHFSILTTLKKKCLIDNCYRSYCSVTKIVLYGQLVKIKRQEDRHISKQYIGVTSCDKLICLNILCNWSYVLDIVL